MSLSARMSAEIKHELARHEGITIGLNHKNAFQVSGPEAEALGLTGTEGWQSYRDVTKAVEDARRTAAKEKGMSVNFDAIDPNGKPYKIRGIHQGTSNLLGLDQYQGSEIYPNFEWIKQALGRRRELMSETTAIDNELRQVRVRSSRGYGRVKSPDEYVRMMDLLKRDFETAIAEAKRIEAAKSSKAA